MSLEGISRTPESVPIQEAAKAHRKAQKSKMAYGKNTDVFNNDVFSPVQKKACIAACKANSQVQITTNNCLGAIYNVSPIAIAEEIVKGIANKPDAVKHKFWQAMAQLKVDSEKAGDVASIQKELFQLCEQGDYEALAQLMPSIDSIGDASSILLSDKKKAHMLNAHLAKQAASK